MAEPGRVVERVAYVVNPTQELRAVSIRRNRTAGETDQQYARLYNNIRNLPREERDRQFERLQRAYTRVSSGLAATGRDDEWANDYITLIGRARARRLNRR